MLEVMVSDITIGAISTDNVELTFKISPIKFPWHRNFVAESTFEQRTGYLLNFLSDYFNRYWWQS